jgi:hypothetical protein
MEKIIGALILLIIFGGLFVLTLYVIGLKDAVLVWVGAFILVILIAIAVKLLMSE